MDSKYIIAKYLRLSQDDGNEGESNSISNQRDLLNDYISKNFESRKIITVEFIDDGYSGTNFNRPNIQKLLENAESKKIDCIIVKDFSRFGREHSEVGEYLEETFPEWQVRFISVNDSYDSNDYLGITSGIDVALKNIVYEMYSRDLSEKVKSAKTTKMKRGEFISPYAIYGYKKDPADKNKLIVDDEAAKVVQRLFQMRLNGVSSTNIAIIFNGEDILTPSMYKRKNNCERRWNSVSNNVFWSSGIVDNLLNDERYTGKMISGKMRRTVVGNPKTKRVPEDEQFIVENTHEAIISQKLFDSVKKIRSRRGKRREKAEVSMLGLLRCGYCFHNLARYGDEHNIKYRCDYKKFTLKNDCVTGKVSEVDIVKVLRKTIQLQIERAVDLENSISKKREIHNLKISNELKNLSNNLSRYKKERFELYKLFQCGKITLEKMNDEKQIINKKMEKVEGQILKLESTDVERIDQEVIKCFTQYKGFTKLQDEIVKSLIETIYIYNDNKIKIVWKHCDDFIKESSYLLDVK